MPDITNPQIIGALIALGGVTLGIVSSWVMAIINRRYEDRRHLRQLAIETAVENWKQDIETAKLRGELAQRHQRIAPLDSYIVHMLQLAELVSSRSLNASNVGEELKRIRSVSRAAIESAKQQPNGG